MSATRIIDPAKLAGLIDANFLIGVGGFMPIVELAYLFDEEPISSLQLSDVKLGAWYQTANFPDQRRDSSLHIFDTGEQSTLTEEAVIDRDIEALTVRGEEAVHAGNHRKR